MAANPLDAGGLDLPGGQRLCRRFCPVTSGRSGARQSPFPGVPPVTPLVFSLLLLLLPGHVVAQQLSLGGRVGFGAANALFEDEHSGDRIDPRMAPLLGAVAAYQLSSIVSLHAELLYSQKGWVEFQTGGGRRLSYLQLPVLFGLDAPWRTSPHLLVGPSIGFELACSITDVPGVGSVGCDDEQVAWDRAKVQYGVWVGLGLGRWFGEGKLDLQLLGDFSLTDTNREPLPSGYLRFANVMLSASYRTLLGGS